MIVMRMWMCNPKWMCRQHLLGEHLECHMFASELKKGKKLQGFKDNNLLETRMVKNRHDMLASEMGERGYNHKSPLNDRFSDDGSRIDQEKSFTELINRCSRCNDRYIKGKMDMCEWYL